MRGLVHIVVLAGATLTGCMGGASPPGDRTAPPGPLAVTSAAGVRFFGSAARVDIRHTGAGAPSVELLMSATDEGGRTWAVQAAPAAEFLDSLALRAQLVRRPLKVGEATVQLTAPRADASTAEAGLFEARLRGGMIDGAVSGAAPELAAVFAGPFVVTCAVPAGDGSSMLVVDERFTSPACKPYADLGRHTR
jgi:hypothetical protein